MQKYFVNKNSQANWDHEVHTSYCTHLPTEENRKYLGMFESCRQAVQEAKKIYPSADGCAYCCPLCHTR